MRPRRRPIRCCTIPLRVVALLFGVFMTYLVVINALFEASPPVRKHSLGLLDYIPYGFSEQRVIHRTRTGGDQALRLKQLPRPLVVTTKTELDGSCSAIARMRIAGVEGAILSSIYAKLASAITVEYIDIHGRHPLTNADLVERVYR